ncbi:uncharacterized protein EAF01_002616 [Botrytis porri]|uniref:Uncharacterized protein n=1 Tax=Botrytis porri TaxID=87229 RepID=A0A4Z1KWE9_9HELO|nr:uncharacterized protein EAF01_002616 [Botrytis porri]KAF7911108.1 hypothetical protein EAF01_002616 [Botrytis porri]TGO88831.1 hypothetical protein BPOR_0139g00050 [Botrytis porri]
MDHEDEAQELSAEGVKERERVEKSQGKSREEDMVHEEGDEETITHKHFWITGLPDLEDAEFRKFTHRTSNDETHDSSFYEPGDEQCSMWESNPDHECYSSFGDGRTTATVNACGQLMQFSTYLGLGKSGMFCVDHATLSEPYFGSTRADDLNNMSRARNRDKMTYGVWIWLHELMDDSLVASNIEAEKIDNSIGVIVSVFIDGVAIKFGSDEEWNLTIESNQTTEVVVAYKLIYSTAEVSKDWKQFLVKADKANVSRLLSNEFDLTQYRSLSLFSVGEFISDVSPKESTAWDALKSNFDFIFQRHLEHLLTVCAIPVTSCQGSINTPVVALTCGDISTHRFCVSASLFAFLFLLQVDSHLRSIESPDEIYVLSLRERIKKVCEGHLMWVNSVALSKDGLFEFEYMVNGRLPVYRRMVQPKPSKTLLKNTAFQIIKAGKFANRYSKDSSKNEWQLARKVVKRREVVQRFTVHNQNYQSIKRMLAVTRSMQESRFLFHARDTALFYNIDRMEWKGTQFIELLKNTIDSQPHHVDNGDPSWDNTLRYALAILIGTYVYKINAEPSFELVESSIEVLFGSFSSNGFVSGRIDKNTKEQVLFEDENYEDSYYRASFKIPYILFQYATIIYKLILFQLTPSPAAMRDLDDKYKERLNLLTNPPHSVGPMKLLINKLKARRENWENNWIREQQAIKENAPEESDVESVWYNIEVPAPSQSS